MTAAAALYRQPSKVAFYHVDAGGRLFFGRVFEFFIDAYHGFLSDRAIDLGRYRSPLVHADADFVAPMEFGNEIVTEIATIAPGQSSMTISYRIVAARDAAHVHCKGTTIHVFVDRSTYKKCPFPVELRAALDGVRSG